MGIKNKAIVTISSVLLFTILVAVSHSQNLGQGAGALVFNVSLGGTQTLSYSIFDGGGAPISYTVSPPQYNPIKNETTPTVTVSPTSGVLQPSQSATVYVTVRMPATNKAGIRWDGIMQVLAATNASNPGGAVIQGGLGKEVIIYSKLPPAPNYGPLLYVIIGIAIAACIVGGVLYAFKFRKGPGGKGKPKYKYVTVKKRVRVKA